MDYLNEISEPFASNMNGTSENGSVLRYPTSFSDMNAGIILPLSNNDTDTDVKIKENGEKYFVLLSQNEANNGTVQWAEMIDIA